MTPEQLLQDWVGKARHILAHPDDAPWPPWSRGEVLAVAVMLADARPTMSAEVLDRAGYTYTEAVERLRHDLGMTHTRAEAGFAYLRRGLRLAAEKGGPGVEDRPSATSAALLAWWRETRQSAPLDTLGESCGRSPAGESQGD